MFCSIITILTLFGNSFCAVIVNKTDGLNSMQSNFSTFAFNTSKIASGYTGVYSASMDNKAYSNLIIVPHEPGCEFLKDGVACKSTKSESFGKHSRIKTRGKLIRKDHRKVNAKTSVKHETGLRNMFNNNTGIHVTTWKHILQALTTLDKPGEQGFLASMERPFLNAKYADYDKKTKNADAPELIISRHLKFNRDVSHFRHPPKGHLKPTAKQKPINSSSLAYSIKQLSGPYPQIIEQETRNLSTFVCEKGPTKHTVALKYVCVWENLDQLFQKMTLEDIIDLNMKFLDLANHKVKAKNPSAKH